jgi:predicted small secreted protein
MKRVSIIFSLLFAVALLISSCHTHQKCPAYGKVIKADTAKKI